MADKPTPDPLTGVHTTGHEWDGIQELNNPIPKWWQLTYFVTVAWAIGFMVLYPSWPSATAHTTGVVGHSNRMAVEEALKEHAELQAPWVDKILAAETLEDIKADDELMSFAVAAGKVMYEDRCAGCHARGGGGQLNYPTLADDDWIWGGGLANIEQTIRYGVRSSHLDTRAAEMPAFGRDELLTAEEIQSVAEYVAVLDEGDAAIAAAAETEGAEIYAQQCASCHNTINYDTGEEVIGGGNVDMGAPRLRDAIWLYGEGTTEDIVAQVTVPKHGVMPFWQDVLDEQTIRMVTLYVDSLNVAVE